MTNFRIELGRDENELTPVLVLTGTGVYTAVPDRYHWYILYLSTCYCMRARQQNSEPADDSRENPTILKSHDSEYQYCILGHNFMVIFVRICPTLEVVRILMLNIAYL